MSNSETHSERGRLRMLFEAALEQPTATRADWIAANVADADERSTLERLVAIAAEDTGGDALATPAAELAARIGVDEEETPAESLIGRRIDRFRLVRLLGQGGMASVFLGEREDADFTQQVAIKLLRRGLYSELEQRLFRRERQALAMLSHPNIAHLLDGGVTEAGIPYLVMDYIDGAPITKHADERRLDLRARLKLFGVVCRAVDAAHRHLIVHRDLKPSNIIVDTKGEPKLLDFGIAKLLDEDDGATRSGLAALTPDYAAPEQYGGGPISTATDVYALGVVLHELLVGSRPERRTTKRPSALKSELRGDLDNIILKALATEPDRRYASAGAFAEDIARYLDGEPVAAHPPSWWYRTRKFVRRHRAGVIVTALATVGLFVGVSLVLWQSSVARREAERATLEAERATRQAERAEAMRSFLSDAFAEAEPNTPRGGPPTIVEVVEQALTRLRADTRMHAGVRAELLTQLGHVLRKQGRLDLAKQVFQDNYDRAVQQFGLDDDLTLAAAEGLADSLMLAGEHANARRLLDRVLASLAADNTRARAALLSISAKLATLQREVGRARADAAEGVRLSRALHDEFALVEALAELGNVQLSANDPAGAVSTLEEVLALQIKRYGRNHVSVALTHGSISRAYRRAGDLDRAESHAHRALEIGRASYPKDHFRLASLHNALMALQHARRDFANARRSAEESLRIRRLVFDGDHPEIANDVNNVGWFSVLLEDYDAALPLLRESLRMTAAKFGAEHQETAITRASYGMALARAGQIVDGEAELRRAITSLDSEADPDPDRQAEAIEKLARLKLEGGDISAALPLVERIGELVARIKSPATYWLGRSQTLRADALLHLGRTDEAAAQLQAASNALAGSNAPDPVLVVEVPLLQAQAARALGDTAAVEKALAEGTRLLAALRHPPSRLVRLAQRLREGAVPVAK